MDTNTGQVWGALSIFVSLSELFHITVLSDHEGIDIYIIAACRGFHESSKSINQSFYGFYELLY